MLMVEDTFKKYDCVIIGGGIFGCLCALELFKFGKKVIIIEKKDKLMQGATLNNTNRLHLGYHYPRDLNTALQCKKGFEIFSEEYSDCILSDIDNLYCISKKGSKVNYLQYKEFCKSASLPFNELQQSVLPEKVYNIDCVVNTKESIYDSRMLSECISAQLKFNNIEILNNSEVSKINELEKGFNLLVGNKKFYTKSIINATYSNYNSFHSDLGLAKNNYQYELTLVPIINWRINKKPVGITLLDGNFFSVLPYGKSLKYSLYHVEHSVFKRHIGERPPKEWLSSRNLIKEKDAKNIFKKMCISAYDWLPSIKDAEYVGFLSTIRMVLPNAEDTDARPSLIEKMPLKNCFFSLFSGKIDHSIWVSKEVAKKVTENIKS